MEFFRDSSATDLIATLEDQWFEPRFTMSRELGIPLLTTSLCGFPL